MIPTRIVNGMPEPEYHAHPALSSSGARKIMSHCPAVFKYERDNPPAPKQELDLGSAAHRYVLGVGPDVVKIPITNRRTNAFKEADAEARAAGKIPLLIQEHEQVMAMAKEVWKHPIAKQILCNGEPEISIFWKDADHGVELRARPDWLRYPTSGRSILPDFKTSVSANPVAIAKAVYNFGYHCQGAWYVDAAIAASRADRDTAFVLVVQEKTPPYLVTCVQIGGEALRLGRERNRRAIEKFARCLDSGVWPDYTEGRAELPVIMLPPYAYRDEEDFDE